MALAAKYHERLTAKIRTTDNGCWQWTGSTSRLGYGNFWVEGKCEKAHRAAYMHWVGPIPDGMIVRHKCDNRGCVNPEHLLIGTQQDNMNDMKARGRSRKNRGEDSPNVKLNASDVYAIRSHGGMLKDISKQYGISIAQAHRIRTRTSWSHLPERSGRAIA